MNNTAITDAMILDCGHTPSPHSPSVTGYGTYPLGGRTACYACCDASEVAILATAQHHMGYLSCAENPENPVRPLNVRITTWTGGPLITVTDWHESPHYVPGAHTRDKLIHWRGVDAHGNRWYGRGPGWGMYTRMHKSRAGK